MSKDKFVMSVGQAHEFNLACNRNGVGADAVKLLSQGENLKKALKAIGWEFSDTKNDPNIIIHTIKVNRSLSPQEALKATGRRLYLNDEIVANMPKCADEEVVIHFFKLNRYVSCTDLEKEYQSRGLLAVDPYALAAFNQQNQEFADDYPNASQWREVEGNFCCAIFYCWGVSRGVDVIRDVGVWDDDWWFAGVRE